MLKHLYLAQYFDIPNKITKDFLAFFLVCEIISLFLHFNITLKLYSIEDK